MKSSLTRRFFIASAAGCAAAPAFGDDMAVTVQMDGNAYRYAAADAKDLGDFVSPAGFTQRCLRVTHAQCPLVVMFRPDADGRRQEVVFELGDVWSSQPRNLGPYSVMVAGKTIDVPKHFWFSRWRWQSAPRPVTVTATSLIAQGLLPPYDIQASAKGLPGPPPPTEKGRALGIGGPAAAIYRPMDLAGLEPHMGATGERDEIGLITEAQARYVCTGDRGALAALRDQAEAAGTLPWHMRDGRTGAPVDLDAQSTMSWYPDRKVGEPYVQTTTTGIAIDAAHEPALAYLPYLLTGDPYHLEDLQFAATYNRGWFSPEYRLSVPQTRAFAWSLRTLAQAARVTPAQTPRWLLPKAYWVRDLDRTRDWFMKTFVRGDAVLQRVFRITDDPATSRDEAPKAPAGTWSAPWMDEFLAAVLGWLTLMGFDDWRAAFQWKVASTIARTGTNSGWARAHATPYRIILREAADKPYVAGWAEAYALTSRLWDWPKPGNDLAGDDLTYFTYSRGVLAIAARLGIEGAAENLAWLDRQLRARNAPIAYKWRLI